MSTHVVSAAATERTDKQIKLMELLLRLDNGRDEAFSRKKARIPTLMEATGLSDAELEEWLTSPSPRTGKLPPQLDLHDLKTRMQLEIRIERGLRGMRKELETMVDHLLEMEADLERLRAC